MKVSQIIVKFLWVLLPSLVPFFAQAQMFGPGCKMSKDYSFNFFISPENKVKGMYGAMADRIPPTVISSCQGASGKTLAFGLGLKQPYLSSDTSDVSFDGLLRPEVCQIKNSPVANPQSFDEKLIQFKDQFKILRSCTYMELTHLDDKKIQFTPDQNYCHMHATPSGKVIAEGDFCYVRISSDLRIAISILLKDECLDPAFLKAHDISPRDLDALLQAFVVNDETSTTTENMIGSTKVRLSLMPNSHVLEVNQDLGPESALFPTTFSTDIHQGPIIIRDGSFGDDKKTFFDISLFLDTRSARKCRDGICVGPGDYQTPMAGEVEIYEVLASGKRQFLDSWYAGNPANPFAKAQWQGLFRLNQKVSEGLEIMDGKTYEVQFNFYSPYDDYLMLIKGYQQILIDLTLMNGTAGKDFIQPLNSLSGLLGLPQIPVLPQLGSTEIEEQLEKVRQLMQKLGQDQTFPPFYSQVCNSLLTQCQSMNATSKYLTLTTRFTTAGLNDDRSMKLTKIITKREARFVPSYNHSVPDLPQLVCQ
ncbi:MAG: hypothetical protein COT73_00770 [Bdellovibrio sp. CG10_big_fil_rev_8_21_14_0_10_47_8]|nr:MAG: hypothetical protein COT73_00770 [Bdellovibrio sp. CG10_big_fil_rev_8_21_14_0_10_47_8]